MNWINPFTTKREDVHPLARIDYDLSVAFLILVVVWSALIALAVVGQLSLS